MKIESVVEVSFKFQNEFKMVVYEIEKFIKKSPNESKLPGLYVMDAVCKRSRLSNSAKERDIFINRFGLRLKETMSFLDKLSLKDKVIEYI